MLSFLLGLLSCKESVIVKESYNPVDFVNPLVGTQSSYKLSNGNTYPAIALPWGMNFWTPQTGNWSGWLYQYQAETIRGFQQCHQPSPWIGNYGCFSLFPITGEPIIDGEKRASVFNHKNEISKPYYYSVLLDNYNVKTEITPTERASVFRFTFPEHESSNVLIDGVGGGSWVKIFPEMRKVTGYVKNNNGGVPDNFANYFVVLFDKDFKGFGVWEDGEYIEGVEAVGEHSVGYIHFETEQGEQIQAKVASSFISIEQAELNLKREIGSLDFDAIKQAGENLWNHELNKVKVHGGTVEQKQNFYTALYRTLLFPRKFYELDSARNIIHFSPYDGKIHDGYMFTDNGFWDTFRAVFPFFYLMYPEHTNHVMQGLVNTYKESGWLPEWASPGHRDCMIGSNSASIIAGAYLNGATDFDVETAYEAILKNSEEQGPIESVGRAGGKEYNKQGYVPCDIGVNESAARTLEYAYDDYAIMQLAQALKKPEPDISIFAQRAGYYKNIYDPSVGFMRGRKQNGSWLVPFNEFSWGGVFTEGSTWHYSWSVFQDPIGLKSLFGGDQAFVDKLDAIFNTPAEAEFGYYGFEIHEITEMKRLNMGQYAHGNQPIQHALYLYNWTSQPWKGQKLLRRVMDELYHPTPDGLCGDEDNGQTSAWYVFSAMGMYPVNPVSGEYAFGSPLFDLVELKLENGNIFNIQACGSSTEHPYIKSVSVNGHSYEGNFVSRKTIWNGGNLVFDMSSVPNKKRGTISENWPFSMSQKEFCSPPYLNEANTTFTDSILVDLKCVQDETNIWYRYKTGRYDTTFKTFKDAFYIHESALIEAYSVSGMSDPGPIVEIAFEKLEYYDAVENTESRNGAKYKYYTGEFNSVDELSLHTRTGIIDEPGIHVSRFEDKCGFFFEGFIDVPQDGLYKFYLTSDDGSRLYIQNQVVVNNDGRHGALTKWGQIALRKGKHPYRLKYFENVGDEMLMVEWESAVIDRQVIPVKYWCY